MQHAIVSGIDRLRVGIESDVGAEGGLSSTPRHPPGPLHAHSTGWCELLFFFFFASFGWLLACFFSFFFVSFLFFGVFFFFFSDPPPTSVLLRLPEVMFLWCGFWERERQLAYLITVEISNSKVVKEEEEEEKKRRENNTGPAVAVVVTRFCLPVSSLTSGSSFFSDFSTCGQLQQLIMGLTSRRSETALRWPCS